MERRPLLVIAACLLLVRCADAWADPGFVGETKCGSTAQCHGGGLPSPGWTEKERGEWHPWKSARTQWLQKTIDHHSRAFHTLETPEARAMAAYMGVEATGSEKCLVCHAPEAPRAAGSAHRREDGVSCEHCHGPAEAWLNVHQQAEVWKQQRADFIGKGFYDNNDLRLRAEKCASCHVAIDHEIIAAGHPPLQFEMVAYAQVMKHWDDMDELPAGAFSPDPTLWGIGQLVGLRHAAAMVGERAGAADYQSLGKFSHFEDRNCYTCHHKLVEDALRQGQGHYEMVELLLESTNPAKKAEIAALWSELNQAAAGDPQRTQQVAARLGEATAPLIAQLQQKPLDRETSRALLRRITGAGERLKNVRRFDYALPERSNVTRLESLDLPWWTATGAPEQAILAILAICPAAYDAKTCGKDGIEPEIRNLLAATQRFRYDPAKFARSLAAVNQRLK